MNSALKIFVVFFLPGLIKTVIGSDYCALPGCYENHIACRNNGGFANDCPPTAVMIDISAHRQHILGLFNHLRNEIAGGNIEPFPKAARMAQMGWCPELQYLAELNVRTCKHQYDKCRSTQRFPLAAQSIGMFSYIGEENAYTENEIINSIVKGWFDQKHVASLDMIQSFPAEIAEHPTMDFTVAINEKNSKIGCGALRFTKDIYNHFLFVCNFSVGNMAGQPVYTFGRVPAVGCKNHYGASSEYVNLCNPEEIYNYEYPAEHFSN